MHSRAMPLQNVSMQLFFLGLRTFLLVDPNTFRFFSWFGDVGGGSLRKVNNLDKELWYRGTVVVKIKFKNYILTLRTKRKRVIG